MSSRIDRELTVNIRIVMDVIRAAHLTSYVASHFKERGGIFFVSAPQQMKSAMIKSLKLFPDALVVSDLNAQKMNDFREDLLSDRYRTVGFLEVNKLYQRNPISAAHLEGTLQALVAEGWLGPAFGDARLPQEEARALVIGGMTKNTFESRFDGWTKGGFCQRFLWCFYRLKNPRAIGDAIEHQMPYGLGGDVWTIPGSPIKFDLEKEERAEIRTMIQAQPGKSEGIPFSLLLKIAQVLKWHYSIRGSGSYMRVIREFARMLQNKYALLDLEGSSPLVPIPPKIAKRKGKVT